MHRWHWWRSRKGWDAGGTPITKNAGGTPAPQQSLETLRGRRVLAFCGLGNPAGFRHTLEVCGYDVVEFHEFPDHHAYRPGDLKALAAAARQTGAEALVCTQKDLVKIGIDSAGGPAALGDPRGHRFSRRTGRTRNEVAGSVIRDCTPPETAGINQRDRPPGLESRLQPAKAGIPTPFGTESYSKPGSSGPSMKSLCFVGAKGS